MKARRGFLLVEALCALALAGVLALACAGALAAARRLLAGAESRSRAERGGVEALEVVAAMTRDADSITVLGDTAIALLARIGDAVVCAREGSAVVLPPASATGRAGLTRLAQPVEVGDAVSAWVEDTLSGHHAWVTAPVESVTTRVGEVACGSLSGFVSPADSSMVRLRLVLASPDARVGPGTPVRLGRRGRLALYESGGQWMLGWRRCGSGTCGAVQPVAGPLLSPSRSGFHATDLGGGALSLRVGVPGRAAPLTASVARTDAGR